MTVPTNATTHISVTAIDTAGNESACSSSVSYTHDTPPTPRIEQKPGQSDPTGTSPVKFLVSFDEPIDPSSFT